MVDRQEMIKYWKQRPFRPFRIYLANGDVYVIRHAELFMVCPTYLAIGIPVHNHPLLLCDHIDHVPYEEIDQAEYLPASATKISS